MLNGIIRLLDTFNSKCLNRGLSLEESKVRIVQKWDGKRIDGGAITREFMIWLTNQEINFGKSSSNMSPNSPKKGKTKYLGSGERYPQNKFSSRIEWIDLLFTNAIRRSKKILLVANYWSIPTEC